MNFLKKDELLTHTALMFFAMMAVHVCNLAYQMVVSRALSAEDYALLMAFLGVLAILSRPLATLGTAMNHSVSLMRQRGAEGDVGRLLKKWMLRAGAPGLFLGATVLIFSAPISAFFHIERLAPVVVTGLLLPAVFMSPVLNGAGLGLQRFGVVSLGVILGALARVGTGAFLVLALYSACGWALLGHGIGLYATVLFLGGALFFALRGKKRTAESIPSLRSYLLQSFFIQIAYAVLMNADIVMVKHYLPGNELFAYASTVGRMVAFLPAAIALAMFPKVVSSGETSAEHHGLFIRSFVYTLVCVLIALAGCLLLPRLPLLILFGIRDASAKLILLTRVMSVAMCFSALLNVVVMFLLAQRRFIPASFVILFAGLYLLGVHFLHTSAMQVAWQSTLFNACGLVFCAGCVFHKRA